MQTFIPETTYAKCAAVLDRQRLGKQRVECLQIMNVLCDKATKGWANHPAVKMWEGYEFALMKYSQAICDEWTGRGYKDTCAEKIRDVFYLHYAKAWSPVNTDLYPAWWGREDIHLSHRSNLLRKNFDHYSMFWEMRDDLPYVWPIETLTTS